MPVMNDDVPDEDDFDAGRRRGEFDDITWRIPKTPVPAISRTSRKRGGTNDHDRLAGHPHHRGGGPRHAMHPFSAVSGVPRIQATTQARRILRQGAPLCHDRPAGGIRATQHADPDRFARHSGTHRLCRHHIAASVEAQHAAFDRRRHLGVYAADTAGVPGACLAASPVKDG